MDFRAWAIATLLEHVGGDRNHTPLFRRFPEGVPENTEDLWWKKVLVHFLQAEGQPCLFCGQSGTTHVLNPCRHVVCDRCFDGLNYSACPSCEQHVDQSSPFFSSDIYRGRPTEKVVFKLIDLGENEEQEAEALFVSLCERRQALSPVDREALIVLLREYKSRVLRWLPAKIPVRENVAIVFGTLFQECHAEEVLPIARRFMTTATDVLRFIAVLSGTDGSLQRETVFKSVGRTAVPKRFWERLAKSIGARPPVPVQKTVMIPLRVCRFKVAKLSRPLRRTLFNLLEGFDSERLVEDMLRHRSYWVWIGEFLHPGEQAARFPNVANAFRTLRQKAVDGAPGPLFRGWYSRLEKAVIERDVNAILVILNERPGEFARRFDLALRVAGDDDSAVDRVLASFGQTAPSFATPVLLTLRSHLRTRHKRATVRVYWPKGRIAKGVMSPDERAVLPLRAIEHAVGAIERELLRRFAEKAAFGLCLIDEELQNIMVPFNERTATAAAISLARGSRIRVPVDKTIRLFLHWCQPEKGGRTTDLDLSVALYDDAWQFVGVCSYYRLKLNAKNGALLAQSSGDLRDAPWPAGASEFVDLHVDPTLASGARFAVLVVNNYGGLPFTLLERGFAGLMVRDDPSGRHFDPRTVQLKFALNGENGIFMPLVLDLRERVLHWLDVQSRGEFELNNVETSRAAITKICPELISYFASGVRPSMYDLALLHAAARCQRVVIRGVADKHVTRHANEAGVAFYRRLVNAEYEQTSAVMPGSEGQPLLAILYRGDVDLPSQSSAYVVFRERVIPTLAASDLLS